MVAPNLNGFNSSEIAHLMIELTETGEAKGVVIILDTLKKFTDLMQKKRPHSLASLAEVLSLQAALSSLPILTSTSQQTENQFIVRLTFGRQ